MLHELYLEYKDGSSETKIVHTNEGETVSVYPQRDNIVKAGHKPFKYYINKHNLLPKCIVRLGDRYVIMPAGIDCHPKTALDDIIFIEDEQLKVKKEVEEKPEIWNFTSSDGKGKYTVRVDMGKLKCNCMGFYKSKGNCKHVKEVRLITSYI